MKVKELLSDPNRWTQKVNARREDGTATSATSAGACKFCIYGAMERCYPLNEQQCDAIAKLRATLIELGYGRDIIDFNDSPYRTHDTVMAVLEKADI